MNRSWYNAPALKILVFTLIYSMELHAEPQHVEVFKTISGVVDFRVVADPKQPYWEGYSGSGKDPIAFRLKQGSTTASYYDCVGKVCGILLEGMAVRPLVAKRVQLDPESKVSVLFKGGDKGVEISFGNLKVELTTDQAINLCDEIVEYWRVKRKPK